MCLSLGMWPLHMGWQWTRPKSRLSQLMPAPEAAFTRIRIARYPGRRYPSKCEAFTRIQISGAVVRHACAMRYQHNLRPSFEGPSCLSARFLSGFSVIHESWKKLSSLFLSMSHVQVNTKQRNFLVGGRWNWVFAFEFFNRQLVDPKGRSCSELVVLRNLAKLPKPVCICRKLFLKRLGERVKIKKIENKT